MTIQNSFITLLNAIADYNIDQIKEALKYDIDGVMFGDDWGQQHGLQMGPKLWYEFIYPVLKRMYQVVTACRQESIHPFLRRCRRAVR